MWWKCVTIQNSELSSLEEKKFRVSLPAKWRYVCCSRQQKSFENNTKKKTSEATNFMKQIPFFNVSQEKEKEKKTNFIIFVIIMIMMFEEWEKEDMQDDSF